MNFKKLRAMITKQGNGEITTKEIQVSSFLRLHIGASGNVELIHSNEEKVSIVCDSNLFECIEVINSGRTLYINSDVKWHKSKFTQLNIKIYYRQINVLCNTITNGQLCCKNPLPSLDKLEIKLQSEKCTNHLILNANMVKLSAANTGNTIISGECNSLDLNAKTEGNFDLALLKAKCVSIKNYAIGNINFFASETINIKHYGEGDITYSGSGILQEVKQFGNGRIYPIEIETIKAE
jgi:Putative auto-transporter adhesin, head GIN domain